MPSPRLYSTQLKSISSLDRTTGLANKHQTARSAALLQSAQCWYFFVCCWLVKFPVVCSCSLLELENKKSSPVKYSRCCIHRMSRLLPLPGCHAVLLEKDLWALLLEHVKPSTVSKHGVVGGPRSWMSERVRSSVGTASRKQQVVSGVSGMSGRHFDVCCGRTCSPFDRTGEQVHTTPRAW